MFYERVRPVNLTSLSYNWAILHIDMEQILIQIQMHLAGIGFDLTSWFVTWGQKEDGIYLSPWNHAWQMTDSAKDKQSWIYIQFLLIKSRT